MTGCDICAYGLQHGWWGPTVPPGRTHHKCCHTTTSGKRPDGIWGHPAGTLTEWQQRNGGTPQKAPAAPSGTQGAEPHPTASTARPEAS